MSRPAAFNSAAFVVTAIVGEGFTRSSVWDKKGMATSGWEFTYSCSRTLERLLQVEPIGKNQ